MKRLVTVSLSTVLLAGLGVAVLECGNGAVCGNGVKEGSEQCDNGVANGTNGNSCSAQCTLVSIPRASVKVTYERLRVMVDGVQGFPIPTCSDLGIANAHLVLTGPEMHDDMLPCGSDFNYDPIMPGTYQATLTLVDSSGNALTKPVMSTMMNAQVNQPQSVDIVFQTTDYLRTDYQGNFDFNLWWGAENTACASGSPAVVNQTITMTRPGSTTPVAMMTSDGAKLDGTPHSCFTPSGGGKSGYEEVAMMPWGNYDLVVTGQEQNGTVAYCKKFSVFVGIGVAVPTYDLVVPAAGGADAGADGGACP